MSEVRTFKEPQALTLHPRKAYWVRIQAREKSKTRTRNSSPQ